MNLFRCLLEDVLTTKINDGGTLEMTFVVAIESALVDVSPSWIVKLPYVAWVIPLSHTFCPSVDIVQAAAFLAL